MGGGGHQDTFKRKTKFSKHLIAVGCCIFQAPDSILITPGVFSHGLCISVMCIEHYGIVPFSLKSLNYSYRLKTQNSVVNEGHT